MKVTFEDGYGYGSNVSGKPYVRLPTGRTIERGNSVLVVTHNSSALGTVVGLSREGIEVQYRAPKYFDGVNALGEEMEYANAVFDWEHVESVTVGFGPSGHPIGKVPAK